MIALAAFIASALMAPSAAEPGTTVQQVQFRAGPGGACPDHYDFNLSDGNCYPSDYHALGVYRRGEGRRYGSCPDGYDFNFSDGRCYSNGYHAPGLYDQGSPRGGSCPDGYGYNFSNSRCYPNGGHAPGVYAR
jgi:hypothetical protein